MEKSIISRITSALKRETPFAIFLVKGTKQPLDILDERTKTLSKLSQYEKLYSVDPLVFRAVQIYSEELSNGFLIEADNDEDKKYLENWIEDTGFLFTVQDGVKDIFIYGNWFLELIPDWGNKTIRFVSINPKNIDYIRDRNTYNVKLDEYGKPLGFQITVNNKTYYYMNKKITIGSYEDDAEVFESDSKFDFRKLIAHFKLFSLSDSYLGLSPLMSTYKSALIRLNLSDNIGESAHRSGTFVAYSETTLPENVKDSLSDTIANASPSDVVVLDKRIKLDRFPAPDIVNKDKMIYYFADEVCSGLGVFLPMMMAGTSISGPDREAFYSKFAESVKSLQERLAFQIRTQVFSMLWEVSGKKTRVPKLKVIDKDTYSKMNLSRAIATLSRRNLIKYDPKLEITLRDIFDLPTELVEEEYRRWKASGKTVEDTKEVDNG
jgi:hypothetical protein